MTSDNGMPYISRNRANTVGRLLSVGQRCDGDADYAQAMVIAQQWRAQHVEPTERCFAKVLECSQNIPQSVATFRMKRMISIVRKIQRPNTHFKLGELDDIGGCRLIVESNEQVEQAAAWLAATLPLKHGSADKDYITRPQSSGYRSRHLLCNVTSDAASYHVEVQIRTRLQHCWSTAVEAAGEIYGTEYKSPVVRADAAGDDAQRIRFFAIVSSLFALEEDTSQVPGFTGDRTTLIRQLHDLDCTRGLLDDLRAAVDSIFVADMPDTSSELFLLKLSRENQYLDVEDFRVDDLEEALRRYDAVERRIEIPGGVGSANGEFAYDNAVLVYARNAEQLAVAYPNYSTNVCYFLNKVETYLN
ncbi:RelA/SpoT domain-containing protein [Bifidobacterium amazonense]|uniref:RelA/SpoT domain-containing protein n=1 Tax=Bifidobacterium amazonense TaxID=2809027 RepID=A0ABS9VY62_9BIFI|nr:RelA/SpoT domain-containing protein [Bifidobacterium amazonense]MCH9277014.1 RelA/SpoT domain-containing protein [Bifidobacterium amazonense]